MDIGSQIPGMESTSDLRNRALATLRLADLPHELLAHRIGVACWMAFASIAFFALLDPFVRPDLLLSLYTIKAVAMACLALVARRTRTVPTNAALVGLGLLGFAAAVAATAISSALTGDTRNTATLCVAMLFALAPTVPWGVWTQSAAGLMVLLASLANAWAVRHVLPVPDYPLGVLLVSVAASIYLAAQADRQRRLLALENQERLNAEKKLEDTLAEMQDLWNNAPCGYHSLDADGRFARINDTELAWLGYTREELVGKVLFRDVLTPESCRRFHASFPVFKERGWVRDLEFDLLCKDGSTFPVIISASAIVDVDGRFVMSRSTALDNGPRKEFERQKADFFSMVAHDIRNPVATVLGGLEVLGENQSLDERAQELVQAVSRSAKMLSALVNDYLDYAKIEAGRITLRPQAILLQPFLRQISGDYQYEAARNGVALEIKCAPDARAFADPMALLRIVSNLVGNALKFTSSGGHIGVRAEFEAEGMTISVSDDGPGIAPEEMPSLFARFKQTESGRRVIGTGLGLFVVKSLAEAHGGSVTVESEVGRGTTFIVHLPAGKAESAAA